MTVSSGTPLRIEIYLITFLIKEESFLPFKGWGVRYGASVSKTILSSGIYFTASLKSVFCS